MAPRPKFGWASSTQAIKVLSHPGSLQVKRGSVGGTGQVFNILKASTAFVEKHLNLSI